ncbi:MAG: hypothetical protein M1817_000045 [Caeruleum heppii]|nr:MAG: hypothetical protein M1817_000045 [Caeruleum heppii]
MSNSPLNIVSDGARSLPPAGSGHVFDMPSLGDAVRFIAGSITPDDSDYVPEVFKSDDIANDLLGRAETFLTLESEHTYRGFADSHRAIRDYAASLQQEGVQCNIETFRNVVDLLSIHQDRMTSRREPRVSHGSLPGACCTANLAVCIDNPGMEWWRRGVYTPLRPPRQLLHPLDTMSPLVSHRSYTAKFLQHNWNRLRRNLPARDIENASTVHIQSTNAADRMARMFNTVILDTAGRLADGRGTTNHPHLHSDPLQMQILAGRWAAVTTAEVDGVVRTVYAVPAKAVMTAEEVDRFEGLGLEVPVGSRIDTPAGQVISQLALRFGTHLAVAMDYEERLLKKIVSGSQLLARSPTDPIRELIALAQPLCHGNSQDLTLKQALSLLSDQILDEEAAAQGKDLNETADKDASASVVEISLPEHGPLPYNADTREEITPAPTMKRKRKIHNPDYPNACVKRQKAAPNPSLSSIYIPADADLLPDMQRDEWRCFRSGGPRDAGMLIDTSTPASARGVFRPTWVANFEDEDGDNDDDSYTSTKRTGQLTPRTSSTDVSAKENDCRLSREY